MPASEPAPALEEPPAFTTMRARRVVAAPAALDAATGDATSRATAGAVLRLRLAPDELLIIDQRGGAAAPDEGATGDSYATGEPYATNDSYATDDSYAIDVADAGWSGAWVDEERVLAFLSWATTWPVGPGRPQLLQGAAAAVPVKVWLAAEGPALVLVPSPSAHDLRGRWR